MFVLFASMAIASVSAADTDKNNIPIEDVYSLLDYLAEEGYQIEDGDYFWVDRWCEAGYDSIPAEFVNDMVNKITLYRW